MTLLNKPSAERHPDLKRVWDAYGHQTSWDDLVACKFRSDGCYVLLAWRVAPGILNYADLASDGRGHWEFQNDSCDDISDADFGRIHMPRDCDWHTRPGDRGLDGVKR